MWLPLSECILIMSSHKFLFFVSLRHPIITVEFILNHSLANDRRPPQTAHTCWEWLYLRRLLKSYSTASAGRQVHVRWSRAIREPAVSGSITVALSVFHSHSFYGDFISESLKHAKPMVCNTNQWLLDSRRVICWACWWVNECQMKFLQSDT